MKGEVPDGEHVEPLGTAKVLRRGGDITIVALAAMVPRALQAAEILAAQHRIAATVIDLRSLVPLDTRTLLAETIRTGRLFTVEENPRLCGWGAEISSIVTEECFYDLDQPVVRITTPHIPLPAAAAGPAWAARPPRERGEILRRAFELIIRHREAIARLITLESGKALAEARAEATYAAEFLRWYSEEAVRAQGEIGTAPSGANRMIILRQPIGVCVFITPWTFPAPMATRKIGPALAPGCTRRPKPAQATPLTAPAL